MHAMTGGMAYFAIAVMYARKKFCEIDTWPSGLRGDSSTSWAQGYKTFYGRNLWMLEINQSVCPWQSFQAF